MSLIYDLNKLSYSGLDAIQTTQRDWSPYLVHFTSRHEMENVKRYVAKGRELVKQIGHELARADENSFKIVESIFATGFLKACLLKGKGNPPRCVCMSECSLPGAINHSSRYGRFGFVFRKSDIYKMGGRQCLYVDEKVHWAINDGHKKGDEAASLLWGFTNIYKPRCAIDKIGEKPQDFTVEREWRLMKDILLSKICGMLCPYDYFKRLQTIVENSIKRGLIGDSVPILPIDILYRWGV